MPTKPKPKFPHGVKLLSTLRGHTAWIGRIAWSPEGQVLATPSGDGTIRLWTAKTGKLVHTIETQEGYVTALAFDPTGHMLASGGSDDILKLWNAETGNLISALKGPCRRLTSVAFDHSGSVLATSDADGAKLWNVGTGTLIRKLREFDWGGSCVAFDEGGRLITSTRSGVDVWDPYSGKNLGNIKRASHLVDFALQPGRPIMASGDDASQVRLWDTATCRLIRSFEGHSGSVRSVAFACGGRLLLSKSWDDTIRLWQTESGSCTAVIPEPSSHNAANLAVHPDLPFVATVGSEPGAQRYDSDRVVHVWALDFDLLLGQTAVPTITYTSAKIVVVGESDVGKSYLAHRIATGLAPAEGSIPSTHGMKFWPMEPEQLSPAAAAPKNQRRDVVLWDLGGQDEYRLVHQLFLHDTTIALVLLDPRRGRSAFEDAAAWNKRLEKQLGDRKAVKLLVGTKQDAASDTIDRAAVERLRLEGGFTDYYETSAIRGRGIAELCEAMAEAIDWDSLCKTSRPELFQQIRDEIEARRKKNQVVLRITELYQALGHEPPSNEQARAVEAVTEQLASQGVIARSRTSAGEPVLVLQLPEIERYAGSIILAARNNPRGVPALELQAIAQPAFSLPEISDKELPVLDCTVQLLIEHGICFQHEGLLVFPSLFAASSAISDERLPHAVSLYYDFAGAIDNIYASLVAWLVLARNFGQVRLWPDRAEFAAATEGLCGLRKVPRSGGFAHLDVYFESSTPDDRQRLFIGFVEEHLLQNGVEIQEHVAVKCPCGEIIEEETIRKRIARGDQDALCPVCGTHHPLSPATRERDYRIFALKTEIEKRRKESAEQAVQVIERTAEAKPVTEKIRVLHLSDLHFDKSTPVAARLQWLLDDLKKNLRFRQLDYLVITGDFTDRGSPDGFAKAHEFVSGITAEFGLSAERCVFVPGNHDVNEMDEAFEMRMAAEGSSVRVQSAKYPQRFKLFSDSFYHKFLQRPYPLEVALQGAAVPFPETGIQFLTLNSCWEIDQFNRKRSGLNRDAVVKALKEAEKHKARLTIALWHHAVAGPEQIKDTWFLDHLQNNGVRIALHGDVHEMRRDLIGYWHERKLHIVGAGSFGAHGAMPHLYNALEISRDLKSVRVHTRCQLTPDGAWRGWNEWPSTGDGEGCVPFYDIDLQ
jgi:GTPase SAR1 family protein/predicted MPP superfamily phosphohydrolase